MWPSKPRAPRCISRRCRVFLPSSAISLSYSLTACPSREVDATLRALEFPDLQTIEAADLFRGGQIPPGKFSLMIRVTFQSVEATLTDAQLVGFSSRIVAALGS